MYPQKLKTKKIKLKKIKAKLNLAWAKLLLGFLLPLKFYFQTSRHMLQRAGCSGMRTQVPWAAGYPRTMSRTLSSAALEAGEASAGRPAGIFTTMKAEVNESHVHHIYHFLDTCVASGTPAAGLCAWSHLIFTNQPRVLSVLLFRRGN